MLCQFLYGSHRHAMAVTPLRMIAGCLYVFDKLLKRFTDRYLNVLNVDVLNFYRNNKFFNEW